MKAEAEIERLRERCEAYKGQVQAGAAEIERLNRYVHAHQCEIARLLEAKRRALAVADERSKENVALRAENERLRAENEQLRGLALSLGGDGSR